MRLSDVDQLFTPSAIVVFGPSDRPDSIGGMVYRNVLAGGFKGPCYGVNPKYKEVAGRPCYKSLRELDKQVDLALIAMPADKVADILDQCGDYGVKVAVVHTGGFAESGDKGAALQERIVDAARRNRIRMLGPNCLGVMRPASGLNASFGGEQARRGNVALVSQSGAVSTAMLDWSGPRRLGFSAVVSIGAGADVGFGSILDYLALDSQTHCILLYVEGLRSARRFMSALRAAARLKPVIVVKSGRRPAGSRAAKSHTGAWVGSPDVFAAAMERAGAVQVDALDQLFAAAHVFGTGKRLVGERIAIVTNGGGPGVLAADRTAELGMTVAQLGEATRQVLEAALPENWSHGNPVDVIGDTPGQGYCTAVEACLADPGVDGVLAILAPLATVDPTAVAQRIIDIAKKSPKPVLACWMGATRVAAAQALFAEARVPHFDTPEAAVEAFSFLAKHLRNQRLLMQSPGPMSHEQGPDVDGARLIIEGVMAEGRKTLGTMEAKAILAAFHIPTMQAVMARTPNEALMAAEVLGVPVVMKINSTDIAHKSDVDGRGPSPPDSRSATASGHGHRGRCRCCAAPAACAA
jgi:acetyltransferase